MKLKLTIFSLSLTACLVLTAGAAGAQDIWVPNYGDGTVSKIDVAKNKVTKTIPIPGDCTPDPAFNRACAEGIVFSADGSRAYVSLDGSDKVAVINTKSQKVTLIDVTQRFDTLAFRGPGSDRIYTSSYALDTTGGCGLDDGGDPDLAAYIDATRRISVIEGGMEIGTIPVFAGVFQMAFSTDGQYAYAVACEDGEFNVFVKIDLDLDGLPPGSVGQVDSSFELSAEYFVGIAVSPNPLTPVAFVTDFNGCVQAVDLSLMQEGGQVCGFTSAWGVRFNPDPLVKRAYVLDFGTGELAILDTTDPLNPVLVDKVLVDSLGVPSELRIVGDTAYVTVPQEAYGTLPSEVIAFDLSDPNDAVQGCGITVGNGGFELAVQGVPPPWACPDLGAGEKNKVHGAGRLQGSPNVHFAFHATREKNGRLKGHCNVIDRTPNPDRTIKCLDVTFLEVAGSTATIRGNARDNGVPTMYEIQVTDNGKPGPGNDIFYMTTDSGFTAGPDTLKNGDIKVK